MAFHHPSGRIVHPSDVVAAGHTGDVELVLWAHDAEHPPLRAAAIGALLRLDRLDDARWLGLVTDDDAAVRRRAVDIAPRRRGSAEVESALVTCLDDTDSIAELAAFALGEIGSTGDHELRSATVERLEVMARDHSDALCREAAVASLGALHAGLSTILHACEDKATVRRRAIIALAPFDGPEVDAALRRALDDRDWQVRQAAEDLLDSAT